MTHTFESSRGLFEHPEISGDFGGVVELDPASAKSPRNSPGASPAGAEKVVSYTLSAKH